MTDGKPDKVSHAARMNELKEWEDTLADARDNANTDHDFYDGKQWTPKEVEILDRRGQAPIVFNRIGPKINYILGVEIDSRKKPRAFPRNRDSEGDADTATDALRYVADVDDFEVKFTDAATAMLIDGTGGMVVRVDTDDIKDATKIISEDVPYNRLMFDPLSRKQDGSDARYLGIVAWRDRKELLAQFPEAKDEIEESREKEVTDPAGQEARFRWYDKTKDELQVVEHYYKDTDEKTGLTEWYECWWVGGGYLKEPRMVQYVDDQVPPRTWCPLTISSPYLTGGNSDIPERYGPVRAMRGPQNEINHRRSKAIHLMSTREVLYEEGAFVDPQEARAELLKADPFVKLNRGRLRDQSILINKNSDLAAEQVQMLMEAKNEIEQVGPRPIPSTEGGQKMSGRLYIAQQESGAMEMRPVFDALRQWTVSIFKRYWWLIRLTWTEEDWFVVQDEDTEEGYRLVGVNKRMPRGERLQEALEAGTELGKAVRYAFGYEGQRLLREATKQVQAMAQQAMQQAQATGQQLPPPAQEQIQQAVVQTLLQHPSAAEVIDVHNIGRTDVNIIIETSPNSVLAQHEQFQELVGMAKDGILPIQDPKILRIIIEASSLRNKRKLLAMLDRPPDEAQQQAQQQAMQAQQMQLQKQMELMSAQVAKLVADAEKAKAQAALTTVKAQATEPADAQLKQAETQKTLAEAGATQQSGNLKQAQAVKTAQEAGSESVFTGDKT